MNIYYYHSKGGKNIVLEAINVLETRERAEAYYVLRFIEEYGMDALNTLNTRKIFQKIYELKFDQNRIFYSIVDRDNLYVLHVSKKQKQKTEQNDKKLILSRFKELNKGRRQ